MQGHQLHRTLSSLLCHLYSRWEESGYSCQGCAALFSRPVLCSVYMHLFACDSDQSKIRPYLTNQQLLLNTYTFDIKLNSDLHCIHYVMMLYLFSELTKQSLGTTSWPNVFITASFRFRITSVLLLWVPSTPFLSSTKTHVYWESE